MNRTFSFFCILVLLLITMMLPANAAQVSSYKKAKDGVLIQTPGGVLRLAVYGPNAIRVTFSQDSVMPQINSLAVIAKPDQKGWSVTETSSKIVLKAAKVSAEVDKATSVVSFYSGNKLLCSESLSGRSITPVTMNKKNVLGVEQHFTVSSDEAFYGVGHDQSGVMNRAGQTITLKQGNTDKIIPVLVSNRGYGIFWDNPAYGHVNLSSLKSGVGEGLDPIPSSALVAADGTPGGLTGEYFADRRFNNCVLTRKDAQVNFEWTAASPAPLPHDQYTVRWTGEIVPDKTGEYKLATAADDGVRLWLDDKLIVDDWNEGAVRIDAEQVKLVAGKHYKIKMEFFQGALDAAVSLLWAKPQGAESDQKKLAPKPVDISFSAEVAKVIDYYLLAGPSSDEVISAYRHITGDAPMYGKWVYGYWQCKEHYNSSAELLEAAEGFRSRKIPIDNIIQDWMYWSEKWGDGTWGSHDFEKARYPDPAGLIKTLHDKYKLHVMISVWPKFMKGNSNYDVMEKAGYLYPQAVWFEGAIQRYYDAYNPKARELFWKFVNDKLFSIGMDAFWLDGDEPEIGLPTLRVNGIDYGHPMTFHEFDTAQGPGSELLNSFPLMHTTTFYQGQRGVTDKKRVFLLSRCAYAGMQRNAATSWSGDIGRDWGTLRRQIPAGLNFVMGGVPYWNTDIGGFAGGPERGDTSNPSYRELFVRWLQYGTFCPMMRVHGESPNKEPWRFGPDAEKIITKYINLRYRLMPYIYSTAWMITNNQYTIMRPLVMDFAADTNVNNIDDQFMFGPAIMVNPVVEKGATSRDVYLPNGTSWVDFWTGQSVNGGQKVNAAAPIDTLPLYVRAGSIIPIGPFVQYSTEKPADPIEVRVYPGANGKFVLYEDENDNYNYEKGKYTTIPFSWNDKTQELAIGKRVGSFDGMLNNRTFKVVLVSPNQGVGLDDTASVKTVSYSGKAVKVSLAGN